MSLLSSRQKTDRRVLVPSDQSGDQVRQKKSGPKSTTSCQTKNILKHNFIVIGYTVRFNIKNALYIVNSRTVVKLKSAENFVVYDGPMLIVVWRVEAGDQ